MRVAQSPASTIDVSNTLTYGSLLMGVCAVAAAVQGNAAACGLLIAAAVVFDTFDGRFARYLRQRRASLGSADVGTQLDSLVDAVTFGLTPIICASVLFRQDGALWWGCAFVYTACAVTRLGFFNISHRDIEGFIGLPAPVAALFWSTIFLVQPGGLLLAALALTSAIAMVAPLRIPRPVGGALALFVAWPVALITAHGVRMMV